MYILIVVQAVLAALHAAAAQAPFFQLVCPELGFTENTNNTVNCTVRGQDVDGAGCFAPVISIKFETQNSAGTTLIGYSIYPACENSLSHGSNSNGRCVKKDANDIYTYEFNVFANQTILTNDIGLRCYADCATVAGNPLTFNSSESCGPPVKFKAQPGTTSTTTTTTETPEADKATKDECEADCIGGSVSGGIGGTIIVGGVLAVFLLNKIKVKVGYRREQITRIDFYAKRLHDRKGVLEAELKKIINIGVRFDVIIDGNRAIQADGTPKEDKWNHLHVLVQLSKIANYNKMMDIFTAVRNFLKENVTESHVRTVVVLEDAKIPDMTPIARETNTRIFPVRSTSPGDTQRLLTLSGMPEYEGDEGEEMRLQIAEQKPQHVIQIEGAEGDVDDAEKKVKSLLWNQELDQTIDVPNTSQIEDVAREYVEEMTGTTIIPKIERDRRVILIQGSNMKYIEKAKKKVLEFLGEKVQMVLVPENLVLTNDALTKIEEETGTTICKPLDNGKERLVIHIKGPNKQTAVKAADKVKALFDPPSSCWSFCRAAAPPPEIV